MGKKQGDSFEVGDRGIVPSLGWGSVEKIDTTVSIPVMWVGDGGAVQWVGTYGARQGSQVLYHANQGVIEIDTDEPVKAEDLTLDQPIAVSHPGGDPVNRHFARFEDGTIYCWSNGKTSLTANYDEVTRWQIWRLPKASQ